jgi:SAM-dependent methyltransferase
MHKYTYFSHNWLILKNNNQYIAKKLPQMTGVVYDFGCGIRPYERDILKYAEKYIGIDWPHTLHGVHADIVADLNHSLPITSETANSIVSFQVLEHLSEPQTMLNEAFRILKSKGNIFISVPFQWHVHEAPYDFFRYTRYGLEYMLQKAGFQDIQIDETSGFWTMWLLKLNYQLVRFIRGPKALRLIIAMIIVPIMWFNQHLAVVIDQIWPNSENETTGYFVVARKP